MGTVKHKDLYLYNKYLERTMRPGGLLLFCLLIQLNIKLDFGALCITFCAPLLCKMAVLEPNTPTAGKLEILVLSNGMPSVDLALASTVADTMHYFGLRIMQKKSQISTFRSRHRKRTWKCCPR